MPGYVPTCLEILSDIGEWLTSNRRFASNVVTMVGNTTGKRVLHSSRPCLSLNDCAFNVVIRFKCQFAPTVTHYLYSLLRLLGIITQVATVFISQAFF